MWYEILWCCKLLATLTGLAPYQGIIAVKIDHRKQPLDDPKIEALPAYSRYP